jgi:hypothetical protein
MSCQKVGAAKEKLYTGSTENVSSGGLYFETTAGSFQSGNLLKVELAIPPTTGLLEFGGRISGFARVLRICSISDSDKKGGNLHTAGYGVAVEFCRPPRLCT